MKLSSIAIRNYRSIRDIDIEVGDLTLFIGANASGKSAILDSLRFLSEAVRARDFRVPLFFTRRDIEFGVERTRSRSGRVNRGAGRMAASSSSGRCCWSVH